jgi:hypothetical protein
VIANLSSEDTSSGDGHFLRASKRKQSAVREYNVIEVVTTFSSFRFPETKSAHLKFSLLRLSGKQCTPCIRVRSCTKFSNSTT